MRIIKINTCLLFVILLTSCTNSVWVHRDFDNIKDNIETISVMPTQVEYYKGNAGSTEPEPEHNLEVSNNVHTALTEVLEEKGFIVKPTGLNDSILATNEDLAMSFTRSIKRFHIICDSVGKSETKKETYKMNPEVDVFADSADVDYLLFSRGIAYGTSEGGKVKDAVLTALFNPGRFTQTEGLTLDLLLIDANIKEAIWYNTNWPTTNYDPLSLKSVKNLCDKLLVNKLIEKK